MTPTGVQNGIGNVLVHDVNVSPVNLHDTVNE